MKKKIMLSLMTISLVAALVGGATFAWFTSAANSNNNAFTAGTLKLGVNGAEPQNGAYTFNFAVPGNIQPGDIVTKDKDGKPGEAVIEIENKGSLDLALFDRFKITSDDATLANALYFTDYKMEFINADGTPATRATDNFIEGGVQKNAYIDPGDNDGKITLAEFAANGWDGIPNGWDMESLKPGAKIRITFKLKFDSEATNEYQGKSISGRFEALATTINNEAIQKLFVDNTANGNGLTYGGNTTDNISYIYNYLNNNLFIYK